MQTEEPNCLDLRGLKCPLPVLKTNKAMQSMSLGEQIIIETTDPLAVIDIPAFCHEKGHQLMRVEECDDHHRFHLEKGEK